MEKIPFDCHLPAECYNDYNMGEMGLPVLMTSNDRAIKLASLQRATAPSWARFLMTLRQTVAKDRRLIFIDGVAYTASINWLRDHIHEMKGYRHWEHDLESYLGFMICNQHDDGFLYEIAVVGDNAHLKFVDSYFTKHFPEDHIGLVRLELEADVEYLAVEGATEVYKATGNDEWLKKMLPHLEKSIDYITSAPKRWNKEYGLVMRPFSIDTWDFTYDQPGYDRNIHDDARMSILHGDNSGVYQAMNQLAWMNRKLGNEFKAAEWEKRAAQLKQNLDKVAWNGNFYTHEVHINHDGAEDADETKILSLSNAYDMNRGITTPDQAAAIINEYMKRRETSDAFAEWFSVDPPYSKFKQGDGKCWGEGEYINGGIASFTAGELAKAAFNYGFEEYGWDILCRLRQKVFEDDTLYFLYDRKTGENIAGGPSGWGAASIIDAIDNGLAGIVDEDVCYKHLLFAPKWAITDLKELRYVTGYETSKRLIETLYTINEECMHYELRCPSETVNCHILLPKNGSCKEVLLNGKPIKYTLSKNRDSVYVDFSIKDHTSCKRECGWDRVEPIDIQIVF